MPVGDLGAPVPDGASQSVDLGRQVWVLELAGDFGDCGSAEFGVGNAIDASQGFFGVPGVADLAAGVACCEQAP